MHNPYDKPVSTTSSILGPTLKFKGELTAHEDLLIQGEIEGSINHTASLTIGAEGRLKANVKAEYIAVEGKIDGNLAGSKSVVVKEGANVKGNIISPVVTLREGATFNGKIDMTDKEQPQASSPEVESAPSEDQLDRESVSSRIENPAARKSAPSRKKTENAA